MSLDPRRSPKLTHLCSAGVTRLGGGPGDGAPSSTPHSSPAPASSRHLTNAGRGRRQERRLLALGMAASALVHLLVVVTSAHVTGSGGAPARRPSAPASSDAVTSSEVMRVYAIASVAKEHARIEEHVARSASQPEPTLRQSHAEPPTRAYQRRGTPTGGTMPGAIMTAEMMAGGTPTSAGIRARRGVSTLDRLAATLRDARLWSRPEQPPTPTRTGIERARERTYGRIEEVTDSIAAAREAARRSREWAARDDEGRRWGISPDCIHLGRLMLPRVVRLGHQLCENSQRPRYFRDWDSFNAQAASARIRDRFDERVKTIRERKDRQRAEKNSTGNGENRDRRRRESGAHPEPGSDHRRLQARQ